MPIDRNNLPLGVMGNYLKFGGAILIVVVLVLIIYFLVLKQTNGNSLSIQAPSLCVCSNCGTTIYQPSGMDCEEMRCPKCGQAMSSANLLAAAENNQRPLVQEQPKTPVEQEVETPIPFPQNQWALNNQPGITVDTNPQGLGFPMGSTQFANPNLLTPSNNPGTCICPICGKQIQRQPGVSCMGLRCLNCGVAMTDAIFVGRPSGGNPNQNQMILAGTGSQMICPQVGCGGQAYGQPQCPSLAQVQPQVPNNIGFPTVCPNSLNLGNPYQVPSVAQVPSPCPTIAGLTTPCPNAFGNANPFALTGNQAMIGTPFQGPTYSNSIAGILSRNCLRCHGAQTRSNLMTYDQVKSYVNNGMLTKTVQPGGLMRQFLSANEADQILSWIMVGAPL